MTDLLDQGAAATASAVRTGRTSARDVAGAAIARVEAKNKAITAIVDFDPAEARAAADAVENREVGPPGHAAFTPLFSLALVPGISTPRGSGRDGLPIGLQIVAPRLHDRPLLAMAQHAEAALA